MMQLRAIGVAAGNTPVSHGVGDRPYPGAQLLYESLFRQLGSDDYGKLLNDALSFEDPRVIEAAALTPRAAPLQRAQ